MPLRRHYTTDEVLRQLRLNCAHHDDESDEEFPSNVDYFDLDDGNGWIDDDNDEDYVPSGDESDSDRLHLFSRVSDRDSQNEIVANP